MQDNMKCNNIRIIGISEGEEEQGIENLFEIVMMENFPNLMWQKVTQIQETQWVASKRNTGMKGVKWQWISTINNNLKCKWLNAPIKRHKAAEWLREHDMYICCLQETHIYTVWKWMDRERYTKQMDMRRKGGIAILISNKIDFKTKALKRDTEGHIIILKGWIH